MNYTCEEQFLPEDGSESNGVFILDGSGNLVACVFGSKEDGDRLAKKLNDSAQLAAAEKRASEADKLAAEIVYYRQWIEHEEGGRILKHAPARAQAVAEVLERLNETPLQAILDVFVPPDTTTGYAELESLITAQAKLAAFDGKPKEDGR